MSKDDIKKIEDPFAEEPTETITEDELEELETIDLPLRDMALKGDDIVIDREIEIFDVKDLKKKKLKIQVKPITSDEKGQIENKVNDPKSKWTGDQLYCFKGLFDDGMLIEPSVLKKQPAGIISAAADEIRYVSGEFKDKWQEGMLDKLFGRT